MDGYIVGLLHKSSFNIREIARKTFLVCLQFNQGRLKYEYSRPKRQIHGGLKKEAFSASAPPQIDLTVEKLLVIHFLFKIQAQKPIFKSKFIQIFL